jgi:hypothetical protein
VFPQVPTGVISFSQATDQLSKCSAFHAVRVIEVSPTGNRAAMRVPLWLIGRVESAPNMSVPKRLALDAKLRDAALQKGFDSIVLLTPIGFRQFKNKGRIPRSMELNVVELRCLQGAVEK